MARQCCCDGRIKSSQRGCLARSAQNMEGQRGDGHLVVDLFRVIVVTELIEGLCNKRELRSSVEDIPR